MAEARAARDAVVAGLAVAACAGDWVAGRDDAAEEDGDAERGPDASGAPVAVEDVARECYGAKWTAAAGGDAVA